MLANVETTDKTSGILFAHGSRFGGHTLFIKNNKLYYVYNFLGISPEQVFESSITLTPGKHTVGMEFIREKAGDKGESIGTTKLYIDEQLVAEGPMRTQPAKFTLSGDGLCVGYDSGDAVSNLYPSPSKFNNGKLDFVGVTVEGEPYIDLEAEAKRAMMRQ
jgi:arylsulfatase